MYGVCCPLTGCFGNIRLDVPENPPNCRCSIDPEWPCVNVTSNDDSWIVNATRRNPSQPEGTGPVHYLIPIENICGSLMVHVDSLSGTPTLSDCALVLSRTPLGDFDLSTLVIYGPRDRDLVLNQVTYGSTMFLCTFFNNSSEDTLSLFNVYLAALEFC